MAEQPHIGRPRKFQSIEQLTEAMDAYFVKCDADKRPYTMSGLANTLDISRSTLLNYENRSPEILNAVKTARARVEQWTEERLFSKESHPVGSIFSLKNNFGWKDTQEVEHTHTLIVIGQPGQSGLAPQLEPPCIDVSPVLNTLTAPSPAAQIAVSEAPSEAKATPIEGVSPPSVA